MLAIYTYFKKILIKINTILIKVLMNIICILFTALILIVVINVICRYILKSPLFWVTELSCYILVYLIFFGAALALYKGEHVRINIQEIRMPMAWKPVIKTVSVLFNYVFITLLVVYGSIVSYENMESYTGSLPIPMGWVYMAAPISGIVMLMLYTECVLLEKKDE